MVITIILHFPWDPDYYYDTNTQTKTVNADGTVASDPWVTKDWFLFDLHAFISKTDGTMLAQSNSIQNGVC